MIDRKNRISTFDFMEMHSIITRVNDAVERFSEGGWINGEKHPSRWLELKKYLKDSVKRYHSAKIGGAKVNAGTFAGRIMVTFDRSECQVTVLGGEDEPDRGCGLHSIAATAYQAQEILDQVIAKWDIKAFAPNDKAMIV